MLWTSIALLGVLASLAWFVGARNVPEPSSGSARSLHTTRDETAELATADRVEASRRASAAPEKDVRARETASEPNDAPTCEVSFVLVHDDGTEQRSGNGQFRIIRWRGEVGENLPRTFVDGRWSSSFQTGETWTFDEICVDRLRVVAEHGSAESHDPSAGSIEIRVHPYPPTILRVVDRATGADLPAVELRSNDAGPSPRSLLPSSVSVAVVSGVPSPIELRPVLDDWWWSTDTLWAGAPGYGWKRVYVSLKTGGHQVVELVPAGNLDIEISGLETERVCFLRVRPAGVTDDALIERQEYADGSESFDALPAGSYRAALEIGEPGRLPMELVGADFDVHGGSTSRVLLHVPPQPLVVMAVLSGSLTIPTEWNMEQPHMSLKLRNPTTAEQETYYDIESISPDIGRASTWLWTSDPVPVGSYEIEVFWPSSKFLVDLGADGKRDVALVIPPPVQMTLRIIDDATGSLAEVDSIAWHPRWPDTVTGGMAMRESYTSARGLFSIRPPTGGVVVDLVTAAFDPQQATFEITERDSDITMHVRAATILILEFPDAAWLLRRVASSGVRVVPLAGEGTATRTSDFDEDAVTLRFTKAGVYSVTVPELPGFESVPTFQVDMQGGKTVHRRIALVPKR